MSQPTTNIWTAKNDLAAVINQIRRLDRALARAVQAGHTAAAQRLQAEIETLETRSCELQDAIEAK